MENFITKTSLGFDWTKKWDNIYWLIEYQKMHDRRELEKDGERKKEEEKMKNWWKKMFFLPCNILRYHHHQQGKLIFVN